MSTTTAPSHSADDEDKKEQELEQQVAEKILGQNNQNLENLLQDPEKMIEILSKSNHSFVENFSDANQLIQNAGLDDKKKNKLNKRLKGRIGKALTINSSAINRARDEKLKIEEKMGEKAKEIEEKDATKEEIARELAKVTIPETYKSAVEKDILERILLADPEYRELADKKKKFDELLVLLQAIPDKFSKAIRAHEKKEKKRTEGTRNKVDVKKVEDFKTPQDIRDAQNKWNDVVNDLGEKPKDREDLYWRNKKEDEEAEQVSEDDKIKYWEFQKFLAEASPLEEELSAKIQEVQITAKNKNDATLPEEVKQKAKEIIEEILTELNSASEIGSKGDKKILLYYVLNVADKAGLYKKVQSILTQQIIPAKRKGKNTYEEVRDKEGKVKTIDLTAFLEKHQPYGERMVSNAQEVLVKLHQKFGHEFGSMEAFREILIKIVKSKGSRAITNKNISIEKAKAIYTSFLVSIDNNDGEKEVLALLIALKEKPPYVFDLINTTEGWQLGTKKDVYESVIEDFVIDGTVYQELRSRLGLNYKPFNAFIIKIAPKFELIRSHIAGKTDSNGQVDLTALNQAVGIQLSPENLKHFQKLMTLPLWASKIGHAYKHAVYLNDHGDQKVPEMTKIQGADTVKELNVMFVNVEEKLRRIARRLADERLEQELKEAGPQGWRQLWRLDRIAAKWWKRNAAEAYRQRYETEFIQRLKEDPRFRTELMQLPRAEVKSGYWKKLWGGKAPEEGTRENINTDLDAIAERFGISWSSNDRESYLTENETTEDLANIQVQEGVKNLCVEYATGNMSDDEFRNRVRRDIIPLVQTPADEAVLAFLEESGNRVPDDQKIGLLDKLRAHRAGLIALDLENLQIRMRLGKAQNVDVKTEVKSLNWSDRFSRWLVEGAQKNRFLGRFISPTTTAMLGYGLTNILTQSTIGTIGRYGTLATIGLLAPTIWPAVAAIAGGSLVGGAFSALRQNKEILRLKAMKERRQALGYSPSDDTKGLRPQQPSASRFERRLEAQGALYQKESAQTLMNNITAANNDYNALQAALAHAIALNEISEMGLPAGGGRQAQPEKVDLISFSSETGLEAQRLALLRTIAEGRIRLRQLEPNRDINTELQNAIATQITATYTQMESAESIFQRLKRRENFRAAGIGALFGAAVSSLGLVIPHSNLSHEYTHLTPQGPVKSSDLQQILATSGYSQQQIQDIQSHLIIDPTTHSLGPKDADYLRNQYGFRIDTQHTAPIITDNIVPLHNNTKMSQADLISELQNRNIDTTKIQFDAKGHLKAQSIADLKSQNINIQEIVTQSTAPSTAPVEPTSPTGAPSGWERLKSIHFNDNQPHPPNQHTLDELRLLWNGKPGVGSDGQVHFTAKDMLNPALPHSHLPADVSMPSSGEQLKVGLEIKINGVNHWKFFDINPNGDFALPPEYFNTNNLGYVAKGGYTLPGLKTNAIAVGFYDNQSAFQVLASLQGTDDYIPPTPSIPPPPITTETVEFIGAINETTETPGSDSLDITRTFIKTEAFRAATPPLTGAPAKHLEYGKEKESAAPDAAPDTAPDAAPDAAPDKEKPDKDSTTAA